MEGLTVHVERWRGAVVVLILVLIGIIRAPVVVAVVHPQRPPSQIILVQIPHSRCRRICVCVLQKPKTLRLARLLIIDQAEVDDLPRAPEDVHNLLFTYSIWNVSDEDDTAAFLSLRHVVACAVARSFVGWKFAAVQESGWRRCRSIA